MKANQEYIKTSYDNTASLFYNENLEIGIKSKFLSEKITVFTYLILNTTTLFMYLIF